MGFILHLSFMVEKKCLSKLLGCIFTQKIQKGLKTYDYYLLNQIYECVFKIGMEIMF
jgi:hypothetical protein